MKYEIFGKSVEVICGDVDINQSIKDELGIYKTINSSPDVKIIFTKNLLENKKFLNTPSIHFSNANEFIAIFNRNKISYSIENKIIILTIEFHKDKSIKSTLNKFRNIGFKSKVENIGAMLHELVLVPFNYFLTDRALVHSSVMKSSSGKTVLFGGTGGVGKTSLELLLCKELNYSFIADDIAVIDTQGYVYPNLAYPKIYAYNTVGNSINNILFKDRNFYDKFQWNFFKFVRGPSAVRRSISPKKLYENRVELKKNKIDEYYILYRSNLTESISIKEINVNDAATMTLEIIINEYHALNQHMRWHKYNSMLLGSEPICNLDDIADRWLSIYQNVFRDIKCYKIEIPKTIEHSEFMKFFEDKF